MMPNKTKITMENTQNNFRYSNSFSRMKNSSLLNVD